METETNPKWLVRYEGGHQESTEHTDLEDVIEHVRNQISAWSWRPEWTTAWAKVWAHDDAGTSHRIVVRLDPVEPKCSKASHSWTDWGVRGNGGGVIIIENCVHCGIRRTTNTWANDPETGEQGLESISYETKGGR